MNGVQVLLGAFDDALVHPFESFAGATKGITQAEAAWQHPAYSKEAHDEGFGKPGTVLWSINHLEYYHRFYAELLRNRPNEKPVAEISLPGELGLKPALAALEKSNAGLRAEIAKLSGAELDQPCEHGKSVAEFLHGVVRHIVWHSGQIATIRRLHRHL